MKPFFKPIKSATSKAKGSFPWHSMIRLWKDNPELFGREYHRRSVIESVVGAEKQRLGYAYSPEKMICRIKK